MSHPIPLPPILPSIAMPSVTRPVKSLRVKALVGEKVMIDASLEAADEALRQIRAKAAVNHNFGRREGRSDAAGGTG